MANITITIPDEYMTRVATALCTSGGVEVSNANAKIELIKHLKSITLAYEAEAKDATRRLARQTADDVYGGEVDTLVSEVDAITIA